MVSLAGTLRWKILLAVNLFSCWISVPFVSVRCVVVLLLPDVSKKRTAFISNVTICDLTHNSEDESSIFLRNFWNKLPIHTTQQPRRLSLTITPRKPQITVFVLLRIYSYFFFWLFCLPRSFVFFVHDLFYMKVWTDKIFHNILTQ